MSLPELKYHLIERFGDPFYCDPDVYPVGRVLVPAEMRGRVLDVSASDPELFQVVTAHLGIADPTGLSDEQIAQVYDEFKRLAAVVLEAQDGVYRFQIRISDSPRQGQQLSGLITDRGEISNLLSEPTILTCPICLAGDATIDTPQVFVRVKDLRKGMVVWTADQFGARRPAVLVDAVERPVPLDHEMIHLALSDGRELFVAAGHPVADGRLVGSLSNGDSVDGAYVEKTERVRYRESATYDILPAGNTATYWANGVLLASTLLAPGARR
jgi:hypothetical protein